VRRPLLLALIALSAIVFLAVSALLARAFSVSGAEQAAITTLVQAEARGDAATVIADIQNCTRSVACRQRAEADASTLKRAGAVAILELNPSSSFSLTSTLGTARVAWKTPSSLPIVQCVRVRHAGNVLSGMHVELLTLSARIQSDSVCPNRF
jgi:hypothetical protein